MSASLVCAISRGTLVDQMRGDNAATAVERIAAGAAASAAAIPLTILLEDTQAESVACARHLRQGVQNARVLVCGEVDGKAAAASTAAALTSFGPHSALAIAAQPATSEAQLSAYLRTCKATPASSVIAIDEPSASVLTNERVALFERHASSWLLRSHRAVNAAADALKHATLPVVYAPTLAGDAALEVGPVLLALDRLASCIDLARLQLMLPCASEAADLVRQHWDALHRRQALRAQKRKDEMELHARLAARPSAPHTSAAVAPAPSAASAASAVSVVSAPPAAPAGPALFYRSSFTPSMMFYRVSIRFSPVADVSTLLAHGLLSESLRSFLGGVGSSQACFQLVDWNEQTAEGIITTTAQSSVGVRAAFMLTGTYMQKTCRIDVQQQSLFLAALSAATQDEP